MVAIRDSTFAYESTTTDAGLTIPMCAYAQNDLLIAVCVGDTGTPTWGCSNGVGTWTQLFNRTNTCSLAVYWKYAAASGEGDVVFTSTVNETYDGSVIAIRDVYQGYTSGSPPVQSNTTQASSTRFTLPTITTSSDDSLVLAVVSSSASAPSIHFVESALQELIKADGAAEGHGVGWFYQKTTGTTTAYQVGQMVGGAGSKAVIEIRAPSGGPTVVPTYPVSDSSIYLTPSLGIAFDGNTAFAATADTNFGTSIAGFTIVDGTVATAVTDIGIDVGSFMSFTGLTNAASATNVSGAEGVVAASRYNVGDRNILTHFRHSTPVQNQRLSPVTSGKGVWFGMRSGATAGQNWKVWQVHGADVDHPNGAVRPIVVNAANTDTIASNGTLSNSDVRRYGVWTAGLGVLTQQVAFGPLWAMDTIVLAGGNAAEPMDIPAIIKAAATNKNRYSSILQGTAQMLCLQDIQFGDGGTNPIYLQLDSTAIELPSQKNLSKKLVNYNGTDNAIGFTYYAGASDTIIHRDSVISSPSRYKWGLHASSSTSATYDFSGLSVIGAGTITLNNAITITGLTINDYSSVSANSLDFVNCTIVNVPASNDSVTTNASTSFTGCDINVSTVTSGNRWVSVADPSIFTDCSFVGGGGHAIRITTAGTYTLSGNTFTGFGTIGSNGAAIYNDSGGLVTLNIAGGGSTPTYRNGTSASTTIQSAVTVKVTAKDASTLSAIEDARVLLEADTGGDLPSGESISITRSGSTASVSHTGHGMSNGMSVIIRGATQDEYNGIHTISNVSTNSYEYTVSGAPASPATGSPVSTAVILSGLTATTTGVLQTAAFNYTNPQPVVGKIRRATFGTKYKSAAITGTITSNGLDTTVLMISDE